MIMLNLELHRFHLYFGDEPIAHFSNLELAVVTGYLQNPKYKGAGYAVQDGNGPLMPITAYNVLPINGVLRIY